MDERAGAQFVQIEIRVAELEQAGPELVLAGVPVLLDEPVRLKRLQQAVDGRDCELQTRRELRHAEAPRAAGQRLENARSAVYRLDPAAACWLRRIRHC